LSCEQTGNVLVLLQILFNVAAQVFRYTAFPVSENDSVFLEPNIRSRSAGDFRLNFFYEVAPRRFDEFYFDVRVFGDKAVDNFFLRYVVRSGETDLKRHLFGSLGCFRRFGCVAGLCAFCRFFAAAAASS